MLYAAHGSKMMLEILDWEFFSETKIKWNIDLSCEYIKVNELFIYVHIIKCLMTTILVGSWNKFQPTLKAGADCTFQWTSTALTIYECMRT